MSATCPANPSYTYQSLLYCRDLHREGVIWRIGDGSKVHIHHDNWIPRSGSMRPLGQIFIPVVMRVANLLTANRRTWDSSKVNAMFSPSDAHDI